MRKIGEVQDEKAAQRFCDFLVSEDISSEMDEEEGRWAIWVHRDSHLEAAREHLQTFLEEPTHARYRDGAAQGRRARRQQEQEDKAARKRAERLERTLRPPPRAAQSVVAPPLIVLALVVAVFSRVGDDMETLRPLFISIQPGLFLPEVKSGEVWRLLTPIFIHYGVFHLVFNLYWLWLFSTRIEVVKGAGFLVALILTVALGSNMAQYMAGSLFFGGLSGVGYGLFGYAYAKARFDPLGGVWLSESTVWVMGGWFVLCMTGLLGPVANTAHAAGLALGFVVGWIDARRR